jgi:spermidine/putrescine transport system substrate-binding protein
VTYNGDALLLMENAGDRPISFIVPEEGTLLWCDYLVISAKSEKPELAHAFLNFLQQPEMAARNAETLYYASTNKDVGPLLSQEHLADPIIHPPAEVITRSEFLTPKRPRTLKRWNSFYALLLER